MSNIEITDDLLYKYYPKVEEYLLDNLPKEDEIDYEFSDIFNKKMKKLINKDNRSNFLNNFSKYSKRILVVVIAFIISIFTLTMSVEAFRNEFIDFIKNVYDKFTIYQFRTNDSEYIKESKFKLPHYLPSRFKEIDRREDDDNIVIDYSNDDSYITYSVFKLTDTNIYLDTENTNTSRVMVNGVKADYIVKENDYKLVWKESNNIYILTLEHLDLLKVANNKNELIKIAENIK